ncbi:Ig-like domain-containing protein [Mycolicibacterium farcinogenes]|uniref:Ig-like domain-containing protein n=1 Tax=Mycolicibacterium farcinogenes TaxID=1802 RepID=UPI0021ADADF6|nr:Ig-like domain-containing protein [Mycolicibacterium farcinogenes]
MSSDRQPVNRVPAPLASSTPASRSASRRAGQAAAKVGGYGGMAVAAWLVAAVATGYGISAAETDGTKAGSPSESSESAPATGEQPTGGTSTATGASTAAASAGDTATGGSGSMGVKRPGGPKNSGKTSSSIQVAPGVTISSSGGAHTIKIGARDIKLGSSVKLPNRPSAAVPGVGDQPELPEPAASNAMGAVGEADAAVSVPIAAKNDSKSASRPSVDVGSSLDTAASTLNEAVSKVSASLADTRETVKRLSDKVTESIALPYNASPVGRTPQATAATAALAPVSPAAEVGEVGSGVFGFVNSVVTGILNPFLAPAPDSPEPVTPMVWALLAWVRRNAFNQAPTIEYNPTTTVQTGQTVTGNIGATDIEGDELTYTVTEQPEHGTVTIDQKTGEYTYTPDDIDYDSIQTDSFTVSVTDGKTNVLSLFHPHSAQSDISVSVLNPEVQRVILDMPDGVKNPVNPRYSEDGKSIYFSGTPTAGGRTEIYQINIDGSHVECLTCGVSAQETGNLAKPVPFTDGSGRVLVLVNVEGESPRYSVLETGVNGKELVPVTTPDGGGYIIDRQREMRPSPDGTHVLYTRIVVGQNNALQAIPVVGTLTRTENGYEVTDARVVYATGEGKQWTPDGKGVIILGGQYDAGNVDDIIVNLETGEVTRLTANPDYDEDTDLSPNQQWIAIGSTRGLDALTPMTRIERQNFLPVYVGAPVYGMYAQPVNVSNQEWAVEVGDELEGENGIPLFDTGDGYAARSMPSWNPDGTAVTFWESSVEDPTQSRLVIANLKYTTSVGPVAADRSTPNPDWAPELGSYVANTTPLPATGTYSGAGGGSAVVTETTDETGRTTRKVVYSDYVNEDGMILNGYESADYAASQNEVHYLADVTVTGTHTGSLKADATMNAFQQSLTGYITSDLDGDVQSLPDPDAAEEAQQNA